MQQGATALSLDAKGRIAIPTRYRERLTSAVENSLVLTAHPHRCLLLYTDLDWQPIRDRILEASSLEMQAALLKRLLVGFAREESLDTAGRLLIPPELRKFAELEKQVWLVGQGKHFEIWSDAGWQKQQEAIFALGDRLLPPGLEDLSL